MAEPIVLVDKHDGLATVTLNRPEKLNALGAELRSEFCRVMRELRADPQVGCVIITGAGRAFCAGLDLKELGGMQLGERDNAVFATVVEEMEVPVIAAVNGFAVTGGLELVLACDIIIASDTAQFADTHMRVGVLPGAGMSARLPRAVGVRKAKEMTFTGNYLSAAEGERLGMVNRVVAPEKLMDAAREMARQILGCDTNVVRQMKCLYDVATRAPLGEALRIERDFSSHLNQNRNMDDMDIRRKAVMERGRTQSSSGS